MGLLIDTARSVIDRIEALRDEILLSRDPEFVASLRRSDERLRAQETGSVNDLRAELESEDRESKAEDRQSVVL